MAGNSSMARSAQILRFVLRHRAAGVFADPAADVSALEDEVVDRCLGDFEAVMGNASRGFWREQLLTNREPAMAALP